MKKVLLEQEVRRIFQLINHGNANKINQPIISESYFSEYYSCVLSFPQTKAATGTISGGLANTEQYGVIFAQPKNIKQLEGLSFSNGGEVYRYGYRKGNYFCRGNTIVYTIDGKQLTYTPTEKPKDDKPVVLPDVVITGFPKCLKNTQGVKNFQDWLDQKYPGWAKGYKNGILNKGKHGSGYGRYGNLTQAAYKKYSKEYCDPSRPKTTTTTQPVNLTKVAADVSVDRTSLTPSVNTSNVTATLSPNLTVPSISGQDLYNSLLNNGNIEGHGRRRLKLKIGSMPDDSLRKLDDYLATLDYTRIKQKTNKDYGSKYVWLKTT